MTSNKISQEALNIVNKFIERHIEHGSHSDAIRGTLLSMGLNSNIVDHCLNIHFKKRHLPAADTSDFNHYIVASPIFPCGVGAIASILFNLEFLIGEQPGIQKNYVKEDDGYYLTEKCSNDFSNMFPTNINQRHKFADKKSASISHDLHSSANFLVVRDPVDVIYSLCRRKKPTSCDKELSEDFNQHMKKKSKTNDPNLLVCFSIGRWWLSPLDYYSMFVIFNISSNQDIQIIRFEDLKTNPEHVVKKILETTQTERTNSQILESIGLSKWDSIKKSSNKREIWNKLNPKGQPYEWKNRMTESDHDLLLSDGLIHYVSGMLSYIEAARHEDIFSPNSDTMSSFVEHAKNFAKTNKKYVNLNQILKWCGDFLLDFDIINISNEETLDAIDSIKSSMLLLNHVFTNDHCIQPTDKFVLILVNISCVLEKFKISRRHCMDFPYKPMWI